MRESNTRGFLWAFLGILSAAGLAIVATNVIVDPFWRYDLISLEGLNAQRAAANSRLGKSGILCRLQPSQIIIGTSRTDVGIDPTHPAFKELPGSVYNASLAGSGIHEINMMLRHAVHASSNVKRILVGVDFLMFNAHREADAYGHEVLDYDERRLAISSGDSCLRTYFYEADRLLGIGGLRAALATVMGQVAKPKFGQPYNLTAWIALSDAQGFRRNFDVLDDVEIRKVGYRAFYGEIQERYYVSKIWRAPPRFRYCFERAGHRNTIDEFAEMVRFARASGIDVRFFINPIHARMITAIREAGLWPQYEDWKRQMVRVLDEDAKAAGKPQLPLWDFSAFNSVTREHIPPLGDTKTVLRGFWEPSHYKSGVGDLMLDRMLGYRDSQRQLPDDFGVELKTSTIDPWISTTRQRQKEYEKAEPDEVAFVKKIVDEAMAGAEGANCGEDVQATREGGAALLRGDRTRAEAAFARAEKLHAADRARYEGLAVPYRELGFDNVLAEAKSGRMPGADLPNGVAYGKRGVERLRTGDYQGAELDFRTALFMDPPNTELHFLRGLALLQLGEKSRADTEFDRGLKLAPPGETLQNLLQQARDKMFANLR